MGISGKGSETAKQKKQQKKSLYFYLLQHHRYCFSLLHSHDIYSWKEYGVKGKFEGTLCNPLSFSVG